MSKRLPGKNLQGTLHGSVIRNAARYPPEDTQVEIALRHRRDGASERALLTVRDYGPGVPEGELHNLFQPFYRVDNARERQTGGAGVGLAITYRAVSLHGGTVTASNAAGGGLLVEIILPLTEEPMTYLKVIQTK